MQKKHLKIDSSLYPPSAIEKCIALFDGYDISFHEESQTLEMPDDNQLILEFFNHALHLTLEK
ncbi:MAG: hypothetical protein HHAS10_09660 [Candidatus Altimarinota bacterium]